MDNICSATNWKDIVKVTAFKDGDIVFRYPHNIDKIVVKPAVDFDIADYTKGIVLSIRDMDASLKDETSVGVAGVSHTVKLEYSMLCDGNKLDAYHRELEALEAPATNYHLLVEYLGGNRHLIRSTRDGYKFDWKVSDVGNTSCAVIINNVSGPLKIQE